MSTIDDFSLTLLTEFVVLKKSPFNFNLMLPQARCLIVLICIDSGLNWRYTFAFRGHALHFLSQMYLDEHKGSNY